MSQRLIQYIYFYVAKRGGASSIGVFYSYLSKLNKSESVHFPFYSCDLIVSASIVSADTEEHSRNSLAIAREGQRTAREARWNVRSMTSRSLCHADARAKWRTKRVRERDPYIHIYIHLQVYARGYIHTHTHTLFWCSPLTGVFYLHALPFSLGFSWSSL